MISRKIGNIVRGNATPYQIMAAAVLASLIAFVPGFSQAPGLLVTLVALLVVLNANLFLAGLIGAGMKLVALLITPVSFHAGRLLLEGPTSGLFSTIVNAPILAWFGFDYYVVAGGMLLGLILGVAVGLAIVVTIRGTWRKMASLESDSEAFKKWSERKWVKFTALIFVGGVKGRKPYSDLLARKWGNPVRTVGVVAMLLLGVLGVVGWLTLDDRIVTAYVRSAMERANGATVDLERVHLDLAGGRATMTGLAMADPDALDTNLFAATSVEAAIGTGDLLRKRAAIERVVIVGGRQGEARAIPGVRVGPEPEPSEPMKFPDMKQLEELLKNADVWKERLATARRWIEKIKGMSESSGPDETVGEEGLSYEELLRRRVEALGYANVRDERLVEKAPRLLVRLIEADDVRVAALPSESLRIRAHSLSTEPHLVAEPPTVDVTSASGNLSAALAMPPGPDVQVDFLMKGLSVDDMVAQLQSGDTPAAQGGTMDVTAKGTLSTVQSDLKLVCTLLDTNVSLGGSKTEPVKSLPLEIAVRGTFDAPSVSFDFEKALAAVGKDVIKRRATEEIEKAAPGAGALLEGLLGGKKKPAETPAAEPPKNP